MVLDAKFTVEAKEPRQCLRQCVWFHLVAAATVQLCWAPASVEVVVVGAVAAIADGRAMPVLAIDIVVALRGGEHLAVLTAPR